MERDERKRAAERAMADGKWQMAKVGGLWDHACVRWRRITLWAVAAIAVVVVGWAVSREREPVYKGKTLSEWLQMLGQTDHARAQERAVVVALGNIGANGLKWMVEWLGYEEPRWRRTLCVAVDRVPAQFVPDIIFCSLARDKKRERAYDAAYMLYALGPGATNAIPELRRLMDDPKAGEAPQRAVSALAGLGKNGLPSLLAALSNASHSNRVEIIQAISALETNAGPAVPQLVNCLGGNDVSVARAAADVLRYLELEPGTVVPALANGLTNSDYEVQARSAEALAEFGEAAKSAVPCLIRALDDPDQWVRTAAEYALERIAPEELEKDKQRHPFE